MKNKENPEKHRMNWQKRKQKEEQREGSICRWQEEGMVKIYYEEALRTKQDKAESGKDGKDVADTLPQPEAESDEDGKDVADTLSQPNAEDMEDDIVESPNEKSRIEMEEVKEQRTEYGTRQRRSNTEK